MIEGTGFGYIIVNGVRYDHDIVVHVDGSVTKRKKELSKPYKKGVHTPLAPPEIEEILDENPEIAIIGSGQYGALPILDETIKLLEEKNVKYIIEKTPKAIEEYNKLSKEKRVAGIFHVTC
ncbi:MAG: hypothetical protein DRN04_04855 [Thermoprotei archaeon]|nr:MAG: hypothetical protein DRN04_04855 [Thermoprotei archaeon]